MEKRLSLGAETDGQTQFSSTVCQGHRGHRVTSTGRVRGSPLRKGTRPSENDHRPRAVLVRAPGEEGGCPRVRP